MRSYSAGMVIFYSHFLMNLFTLFSRAQRLKNSMHIRLIYARGTWHVSIRSNAQCHMVAGTQKIVICYNL